MIDDWGLGIGAKNGNRNPKMGTRHSSEFHLPNSEFLSNSAPQSSIINYQLSIPLHGPILDGLRAK
jgi:hypothetical protein